MTLTKLRRNEGNGNISRNRAQTSDVPYLEPQLTTPSRGDRVQAVGCLVPYERSQAIEDRMRNPLKLIRQKKHSTPARASALGISKLTLSRHIVGLRGRGYSEREVKLANSWRYEIISEPPFSYSGNGGNG